MPASRAQIIRNRIGGKLRHDPDADVTELRRELKALVAGDCLREAVGSPPPLTAEQRSELIATIVDAMPPLTPEQLAKLSVLLHPDSHVAP
jgi:hypothetical protein